MNIIKKVCLLVVALVVLFVVAVGVAAATIDPNKYRDQIADTLSKQIGRTVKLNGPIHFALSSHGVGLSIQDVAIGNPAWASRPQMASMGKLQLGVALMPLISHQLVITQLDIANADILLESNAANQNNWDLKPAAQTTATSTTTKPATASSPVGVRVNELSVADSQLAMRDKDGKTSIYKVTKLKLEPASGGIQISFDGRANNAPIKLDLKADTTDLMSAAKWPFQLDLTYDKFALKAKGQASVEDKFVEMNPYNVSAGGSTLHGQITVDASGAKPDIKGTLQAEKLDVADFKPAASNEKAAPAQPQAPADVGRLFSSAPLDLSALRSADATLAVTLGEVKMDKATLDQVSANLALSGGRLTLAPVKATLGNSPVEGQVKLDASGATAQYALDLKVPQAEIGDLLKALGVQQFVTGKGDADIQLSGTGNSPHDLASTTNGHITVTAEKGVISSAAAGNIASGLMQVLSPGSNSNPTLDCLAARYIVTNGVAKDNGVLMDSSASTVAGSGGFDLREETIDMVLNAKPKLINTAGFMPPLTISGPLTAPHFGIDTNAAVKNVATTLLAKSNTGNLLNGIMGGGKTNSNATANAVPTLVSAPAGQNACVYTLDHKNAAATPASTTPGAKGAATQQPSIKNIGNQLKGLFGH